MQPSKQPTRWPAIWWLIVILRVALPGGEAGLLGRRVDRAVQPPAYDHRYPGLDLPNTNGRLYLINPRAGRIVDSANADGGPWPAGNAATFAAMERSLLGKDSARVWVTYDARKDKGPKATNAAGNPILGTPGRANRPLNVTPTPAD